MKPDVKNILDVIELRGEDRLKQLLSLFSCPVNPSIENFIRNRAIDFARRKISITYLVNDPYDGQLLGFVTLAHKALLIPREGLSNTLRKRIERYAKFDKPTNSYMTSAFLVAQLGKNFGIDNGKRISGTELLKIANDILTDIQRRIGGGIIYLTARTLARSFSFTARRSFRNSASVSQKKKIRSITSI